MKTNCKDCGHFKDNHVYGETTDDSDKIGHCMERKCDCVSYESPTMTLQERLINEAREKHKRAMFDYRNECGCGEIQLTKVLDQIILHTIEQTIKEERERIVEWLKYEGYDYEDNQALYKTLTDTQHALRGIIG